MFQNIVANPKHKGKIEIHVKNKLSYLMMLVNYKSESKIAVYSNTKAKAP